MRQITALQLFNLCFGLFDAYGFGIINEQRDDLHFVDLRLPELPGKFRILTDRLAEFSQLRQSDAVAFKPAGLFCVLLPMRNPPRILIRFQVVKDF